MSARIRPFPAASTAVALVGIVVAALGVPAGCDNKALDGAAPAASSSATPGGLTPEMASKVLAKVGDHTITLGEFAATIDRMDRFERFRYQSPERRKELLDDMIKVELLADEAKRRGLDKEPETRERIRQILRDELLRQARKDVPAPANIPESDVRAYYDKHHDEFRDPERRRVSVIVMTDATKAKDVLAKAEKATPMEWGKLVEANSIDKPPKPGPTNPVELFGDIGIVNAPGSKETNTDVPDAVRDAVFKIDKLNGVYPDLVKVGDKLYIVRMTSKTDARDRSLADAERTIRVAIVQERISDSEKSMEDALRRRFPVKVDDAALAKVQLPSEKAPADTDGGK